MPKKLILFVVLIVVLIVIYKVVAPLDNKALVGANLSQEIDPPIAEDVDVTPFNTYNPPKEFKFDSSTDLETELDSVNPQVFDGDFDDLNNLQKSSQ